MGANADLQGRCRGAGPTMARSESGTDCIDRVCRRSPVTTVFAWVVRFTKGGSRVSISLRDPGFVLPPPSAATLRRGAEICPEEMLVSVVTNIER